mgnify:CR=1 FL=1
MVIKEHSHTRKRTSENLRAFGFSDKFFIRYEVNNYKILGAFPENYLANPSAGAGDAIRCLFMEENQMVGNINASFEQEGKPDQYDPELFVRRESELNLIEAKVEQGRLNTAIDEPLVNFFGVGGNGKTWLMRRIQEKYRFSSDGTPVGDKPTVTIYFDCHEAEKDALLNLSAFLLFFADFLQTDL